MIRLASFLIFLLLLVAVQTSVLPGLHIAAFTMLPLVALILYVFYTSNNTVLWAGVATGFLLDLFSALPFGIFLVSSLIVALCTQLTALRFVTNRSLYSAEALTVMGTVLFHGLLFALGWIALLLQWNSYRLFWQPQFAWQIVGNMIAAFVFFLFHDLGRAAFSSIFFVAQSRQTR